MGHTVENLGFPEATVEAVTEFRQVTRQVLWADTMMGATNIAVDIGDQGMDPGPDRRASFPEPGRAIHGGETNQKSYLFSSTLQLVK